MSKRLMNSIGGLPSCVTGLRDNGLPEGLIAARQSDEWWGMHTLSATA